MYIYLYDLQVRLLVNQNKFCHISVSFIWYFCMLFKFIFFVVLNIFYFFLYMTYRGLKLMIFIYTPLISFYYQYFIIEILKIPSYELIYSKLIIIIFIRKALKNLDNKNWAPVSVQMINHSLLNNRLRKNDQFSIKKYI